MMWWSECRASGARGVFDLKSHGELGGMKRVVRKKTMELGCLGWFCSMSFVQRSPRHVLW
jgi:hypothetical protein